jgi:hypothetical protein
MMDKKDKHLERAMTHLLRNEKFVISAWGKFGEKGASKSSVICIVTDRRVLFFSKGILREDCIPVDINSIQGLQRSSSFGTRMITFHTISKDIVWKTRSADDEYLIYQHVEELRSGSGIFSGKEKNAPKTKPTPTSAPMPNSPQSKANVPCKSSKPQHMDRLISDMETDIIVQMKRIYELKRANAISEEEFLIQKNRLTSEVR